MMKLTLDIKPLSTNVLWQGRRFKTKRYKNYESTVAWLLPKVQMVKGFVDIHYKFYLKNWKLVDGDNCVKGLQDILVKAGFIEDDRKILRYIIDKPPAKEDKIIVEIKQRKEFDRPAILLKEET